MAWFYDLLINSGVDATAASWGTVAVAVLLIATVLSCVKSLWK